LDLNIQALDALLDQDVQTALPEKYQNLWQRLSPTGRANIQLTLQRNLPEAPGRSDYRFVLEPKDMTVIYKDFPYPFSNITGRLIATPQEIHIEKLTCRNGSMYGELEGMLVPQGEGYQAELKISANDVSLDETLLKVVPGDLAHLADRFQPGGSCDLQVDSLRMVFGGAVPNGSTTAPVGGADRLIAWRVAGQGKLTNATMDIGFGQKTLSGIVSGVARKDARGLAVQAAVALDSVQVGKHTVTDLTGKLAKSPTSKIMRLEELTAQVHGGRLAGIAEVELTEPLRYGIQLSVERMRLEELFASETSTMQPTAPQKVVGFLDGSIELRETAGKTETRQAKGVLRISRARLRKLPVLLDMMTVVYLALPHKAPFSEGEFVYLLSDEKLVFEEIYLRSGIEPATIALVGSGTMDMKSQQLNLKFLSDPAGRLPRLGGLGDEVLEGIWRELLEIRVTGTLSRPETRAVTLGSLEDFLAELLAPTLTEP